MHDEAGKNPAPNPRDETTPDESDIPALALDTLDAGACVAAEHEINTSPEGRREFRAYADAVGLLGLATAEARPQPDLKSRILDATANQTAPTTLADERAERRSPLTLLSSLAAVLLILALGAFAAQQWSTANDRADEIDALKADLQARDERIDDLEEAARNAGVYINFEQPLVWKPFEIPNRPQGAWGYLIHTLDGQTAYLVVARMPLDQEQVYQAWVVEDTPVSAGTLRTDGSGMGFLILQFDGEPLQNFRRVGITIEPPGGSPQPTSDPVMIAELV